MRRYGKKTYSSSKNDSQYKPKKELTPEQLEKMRLGREAAAQRRKEEAEAKAVHNSRLEAVAEIDAKLKKAAKEERMYEEYARKALKHRHKSGK